MFDQGEHNVPLHISNNARQESGQGFGSSIWPLDGCTKGRRDFGAPSPRFPDVAIDRRRVRGVERSAKVDVCDQQIRGEPPGRPVDPSARIHDRGRSVRHPPSRTARDIGANHPDAVFRRQGDVDVPRIRDHIRFLWRKTVIRGDEQCRRSLRNQASRELRKVGVVADEDAERQPADGKTELSSPAW